MQFTGIYHGALVGHLVVFTSSMSRNSVFRSLGELASDMSFYHTLSLSIWKNNSCVRRALCNMGFHILLGSRSYNLPRSGGNDKIWRQRACLAPSGKQENKACVSSIVIS
jgi:hypothetical protein